MFLPYGSDDPSVLFFHPLTSAPTNVTIPCAVVVANGTSSPTFDPVKGMMPGTAGFRCQTLTGGSLLDYTFQISFQVERSRISAYDATGTTNGSTGTVKPANAEYPISCNATSAITFLALTDTIVSVTGWGAGTTKNWLTGIADGTPLIHSDGLDDWVTVNIAGYGGSKGGVLLYGIDGVPLAYGIRNAETLTGVSNDLYIGSERGQSNTFLSNSWMRNLQVATSAPMFPTHPKLRKLIFFGDSYVGSLSQVTSPLGFNAFAPVVYRELAKKGVFAGSVVTHSYGEHSVNNTATGNAGPLKPYRGDVANAVWAATTSYALNTVREPVTSNGYVYQVTAITTGISGGTQPTWPIILNNTVVDGGVTWTCRKTIKESVGADTDSIVIFRASVNDAIVQTANAIVVYNYEADLKEHITAIMNMIPNGYLILPNIPSLYGGDNTVPTQNGVTQKANLAAANAVMAAIPAWWDTANPTKAGRVIYLDTFTYMGADVPAPNTFKGMLAGTLQDIHPASLGNVLMGKQVAEVILSNICK